LPFLDGAPDFLPHLKPIASEDWLVPDPDGDAWLLEKRQIMVAKRDEVMGGDLNGLAANELLDLVQAVVSAPLDNGWASALEQTASLVTDDFCILEAARPGDWRLVAGVLCAPTLDLGGLHGPVPGGDPELAGRIGRVFTGLRPGAVLERFNWTVQASDERYTPQRPEAAGKAVSDLHLRVERQTVRKLADTGAVVFTIRICLDPLAAMLRDPVVREAFEDAWLGAGQPVRAYKDWGALEKLVAEACRQAQTGAI